MLTPTPINSFLGGLGLPLPMHALTVLNGSVFGISGFLHRSLRGDQEAMAGVAGLVVGGIVVGIVAGIVAPSSEVPAMLDMDLYRLMLSGFLVGLGTKMAKGCTSGHMLSGIGRLSKRSIVATATFFVSGMIVAQTVHGGDPSYVSEPFHLSWAATSVDDKAKTLLMLQLAPLLVSYIIYQTVPRPTDDSKQPRRRPVLRVLSVATSAVNFALALALSNLTDPRKVISFLQLPSLSIDPSLGFLSLAALPLSILLNKFFVRQEVPVLGGPWAIPKGGQIDKKLLCGAAVFGVGWGFSGICPGPALVNLGTSLVSSGSSLPWAGWVAAAAVGGLFA